MSKATERLSRILVVATACIAVLLCAGQCLAYSNGDPEFRAFYVDCIHSGMLTQSQVDNLLGVPGNASSIGQIRSANCNAIIVEVRRSGSVCYDSALGEPYFTSGNFDALSAILRAAHDTTGGKKRIEVHAWIVTFLTGGGTIWNAHKDPNNPDNYWPTLNYSGATVDSAWDPGHPKVQKYIVDVMMDLVTNFDVDGVHYDYIRFTGGDQGYNPTSIARYNARYGTTGLPSPTDDQFDQWRRDQITGIVRQVYARIQAVKPNVLQSGSFVTWNPSPTASTRAAFQATRPYGNRTDGVFSDWDSWMQEGIMDFGVPMTYYDDSALPDDYDRWLNFIKDRKFSRQMVNGPGLYKNWLSNNDVINQLLETRVTSPNGNECAGFCGFSYYAPFVVTKPTGYGTWAEFKPEFVSQVCPTWADIPERPWKTHPTKGHISGSVTIASTGAWADGALMTLDGPEHRTQYCDGTGFYAFIDLTPGTYTVTASLAGRPDHTDTVNVALGSVTGNMYVTDMQLGDVVDLIISNVASSGITNGSATITWDTNMPATSQVEYGLTTSYGSSTMLDPTLVTSHSQTLSGLAPATVYHYRVKSSVAAGTVYSNDYTFITDGPPTISNVGSHCDVPTSATITWTTDLPADSRVNYGTDAGYGLSATDTSNVTSHSITLTGLNAGTEYHFQCVSTNGYGSDTTTDYTFTTVDGVVVDNTDPGWQSTGSGAWSSGSTAGVPKIGPNYLYYAGQTSPTRACTWTPTLTVSGLYDVYAYYQKGTNRNTAARYTTYYNGGQITSIQNQNAAVPNLGGWFLVAENKPFLAGTSGYLELTNESSDTKYVSADAAKWVFKSGFDTTPPTVSIGNPSAAVTKSGPVSYTITYEGADTVTLASADVLLESTGDANATVTVTGTGTTTRTVTLSSITGTGTLGIILEAGTASDLAGNQALAAGPSALFTVDNSAPVISSVTANPTLAAIGDKIHVVVELSDEIDISGVTADSTALTTATGSIWTGDIDAIGPWIVQPITVIATDAVGNAAINTSASYRAAQIVAAKCADAWSTATTTASGLFLFKFWGSVSEISDDYFSLSDGSQKIVTVHAPGYKAKVGEGGRASARGRITAAGCLESSPELVVVH